MTRQPLILTLSALSLLALSAAIAAVTGIRATAGQSGSTIQLVAIDAVPQGNTATSIASIDYCLRTEVGSQVTVDVVVDAVPDDKDMIGFEIHVLYDPKFATVTAVDNQQLLAASGIFQPVPLSDQVPDSDGDFMASVLDFASDVQANANIESGPGVLTRITLQATAKGLTNLNIGFDPTDFNPYPVVLDNRSEPIEVDQVRPAVLAIGQACPPAEAQPSPTSRPGLDSTPVTGPAATATAQQGTPRPSETPAGPDGQPIPASAGPGTPDLRTPSVQATASAIAGADGDSDGAGDSGGDGGGSDGALIAVIAVVAALGLAAAAGGAWYLYRRGQTRA